MFLGKSDFWELVNSYDTLKKKTELVIKFYEEYHPDLNESFFKGLD